MIYPLSAGLLISMAIRFDHSFGVCDGFWLLNNRDENKIALANKQIRLIREAKLTYDRLSIHAHPNELRFSDMQQFEEMSGKGFYKPELELRYTEAATTKAFLEATQLVNDKVVRDGPKPTISFPDHARFPMKELFFD